MHVRNLFFGANELDADTWVVGDPLKDPVEVDPMRTWHVSHRKRSALDCHIDDWIVILEDA